MQSIRFLASRLPLAGRPFCMHVKPITAAALTADYSPVCEQQVNQQINNELGASQAYVALGVHFAAVKVQLFGFASFFLLQADEERDHAASFIRFQHMRGARVCLGAIEAPDVRLESGSLEKAFGVALAVEQKNLQSLFELHRVARAENDEMLAGFVGGDCLSEQVGVGVIGANRCKCSLSIHSDSGNRPTEWHADARAIGQRE